MLGISLVPRSLLSRLLPLQSYQVEVLPWDESWIGSVLDLRNDLLLLSKRLNTLSHEFTIAPAKPNVIDALVLLGQENYFVQQM